MKVLASSSFLLLSSGLCSDASTNVAVIELGVGGSVHRTTSKSRTTSVEGASSFIQSMHGIRALQQAGMPMVPDLFKKADAGVVVGLSGTGANLESMPSVAELLDVDHSFVVGHMETNGAHCNTLVSRTKNAVEIVGALPEAVESAAEKGSLSGIKMTLHDSTEADGVDKDIGAMIIELNKKFKDQGKTVIVYFVIEGDSSVERRRLEDQQNQQEIQQGKYYFYSKRSYYDNQEGGNAGGEENPFASMFPGYYGYGYYDADGEWVTPYKTMHQIQYFNVVLWTAVGLFVVFFASILMMMFMPLEPDTLLFGESAKMIGED